MKFFTLWTLFLSFSFQLHAYTKGKTYKLTILHTNDHHGRFWPNKDGEYGLAPRATLINQIRDEVSKDGGHVLLLDAGDIIPVFLNQIFWMPNQTSKEWHNLDMM